MPGASPPRGGLGWAAFGTCASIWGSTFLFIALGNATVPPVWGATLRLTLAAAILSAILLVTRQPFPRGAALRAAARFGFFQFGLNFPLLYLGETEVPSGLSAVIFSTIPLSMALLARAYGLEALTRPRIAGALVALAGVAVIFSGQMGAHVRLWPMLLVLFATWAACLGTVSLKRGPRQSPVGANAVGAAVGAFVCLIGSFALREPHALPASWTAIVPILYLAIAGSVVAFVLMAWLVNHWDVTHISYISVIIPVVALALGGLVRHERVAAGSLAGAAVVLVGVAIGLELWRPWAVAGR